MMKPLLRTTCKLGEGPLWAGDRLFWFDIAAGRLHEWRPHSGQQRHWDFGLPVSAAARLLGGDLLVASARALLRFDPASGRRTEVLPLEADEPATRSNDGRADRQGGFWIGTMGLRAEPGRGALYRVHCGTLRRLRTGLTIPNAICFSPAGDIAYFADTAQRTIWRWALDRDGWPLGEPATFVRVPVEAGSPDGAVVDSEGCLWNARWGAGAVVRMAPDGRPIECLKLAASQPSCPAFGGADLATLYVTTAQSGLDDAALRDEPDAGRLFAARLAVPGLPENPVEL